MFYAGDGECLVALETRWQRDKVVTMRCGFDVEEARYPRNYPQFGLARRKPGNCYDDDGNIVFRMVFDEDGYAARCFM